MPSRQFAGVARDIKPEQRKQVRALGFVPGKQPIHYTLAGSSASAAQTALILSTDGLTMVPVNPGMPVVQDMEAVAVAVSWVCDAESGNWTLEFQRRLVDDGDIGFSTVATIEVATS